MIQTRSATQGGNAPMIDADALASIDMAWIFAFIFLRSRSTRERLPSASDRLPPARCCMEMCIRDSYLTALKIVPNEPSVLSNLGLSYALAKDLPKAETTLRLAAGQHPVDPRVRQNLALVVGLQGRFAEAEGIARADLPPDQAAANVAYLRQMLAHKGTMPLANQAARYGAGPS